jgi:hypothetical protein
MRNGCRVQSRNEMDEMRKLAHSHAIGDCHVHLMFFFLIGIGKHGELELEGVKI